jgi:hypothetical protein
MFYFFKHLFGNGKPTTAVPPGDEDAVMSYMPRVVSAQPIREYALGNYRAILFGDIESAGIVQYRYILAVFDAEGQPCFFVASEVNQSREALGGGSHFLGVFPGCGHENLGDSDAWADLETFACRAVEIVKERLAIP